MTPSISWIVLTVSSTSRTDSPSITVTICCPFIPNTLTRGTRARRPSKSSFTPSETSTTTLVTGIDRAILAGNLNIPTSFVSSCENIVLYFVLHKIDKTTAGRRRDGRWLRGAFGPRSASGILRAGDHAFSSLTAQILYSGCLDNASKASFVRLLIILSG